MSRDPAAGIDREALIALLERRAELLAPADELITRTLQKCVAYDRRSGRLDSFSARASSGSGPSPGESDPAKFTDALPQFDQGDEPSPSPGVGEVEPDVAAAPTIPEESVVPPPQRHAIQKGGKQIPILSPGTELAGYRIDGLLGSGGMGQVYSAHQISMNRSVAFKVLSPRLAGNASFRNRFIREARNAGRLQHPNLIAVHDVGEKDSQLFFSMELVDGESVGEQLKRLKIFAEDRALAIAKQVLDALVYAHGNGVVHRDIKPDNIMVTGNGTVKVADLGLSRGVEDVVDGSTTQSGTMMGTPFYMPPEQGRDAHSADHRADIYAIGATLYHLVCGQVPFRGRTAVEVVLNASTKPLSFPDDGPCPPVRKLIQHLMEKAADDRPQSAEEARELVERTLALINRNSTTDPLTGDRLRTVRRQSNGFVGWLVAAVIVAALGLGGWYLVDQMQRNDRWAGVETQVEQAMNNNRFDQARDHIDTFLQEFPGGDAKASALRAEVVRVWNDYARSWVEDDLVAIEERMAERDYAGAGARIQAIGSNPILGSPAIKVELDGLRRKLADLEGKAWQNLRKALGPMLEAGESAAVLEKLRAFRPSTPSIKAEVQALADKANVHLADPAPARKPNLRTWLGDRLAEGVIEGKMKRNGENYPVKGTGATAVTVDDLLPEEGTMSFVLEAPVDEWVTIGLGRGFSSKGFRIRGGQLEVLERAAVDLAAVLERRRRRDDAAGERRRADMAGRLRRLLQESGRSTPVTGQVIIDVTLRGDQLEAQVRGEDGRYRVVVPRPTYGTFCSLAWKGSTTISVGR